MSAALQPAMLLQPLKFRSLPSQDLQAASGSVLPISCDDQQDHNTSNGEVSWPSISWEVFGLYIPNAKLFLIIWHSIAAPPPTPGLFGHWWRLARSPVAANSRWAAFSLPLPFGKLRWQWKASGNHTHQSPVITSPSSVRTSGLQMPSDKKSNTVGSGSFERSVSIPTFTRSFNKTLAWIDKFQSLRHPTCHQPSLVDTTSHQRHLVCFRAFVVWLAFLPTCRWTCLHDC